MLLFYTGRFYACPQAAQAVSQNSYFNWAKLTFGESHKVLQSFYFTHAVLTRSLLRKRTLTVQTIISIEVPAALEEEEGENTGQSWLLQRSGGLSWQRRQNLMGTNADVRQEGGSHTSVWFGGTKRDQRWFFFTKTWMFCRQWRPPEHLCVPRSRADPVRFPGCSGYFIHHRFRDLCTWGDLEEFGIAKTRIKDQTNVMNVNSMWTTGYFMFQINPPVKQIETPVKLGFVGFSHWKYD